MDLEDLVLRIPKGSPLTPTEMDDDLDALRDAIQGLSALFGVALNPDGSLKNPPTVYGASAAGTDAYAITPTPAVASLASLLGRFVILLPDVANSGAATLDVSGLGAQPIKKFFNQPLDDNDIKVGQHVVLSWNGTNFQMQSWPAVVQPVNYGVDSGAANAYVVVQSGTIAVPSALYAGYKIAVKISAQNSGASTLQVGALAAVPIKKNFSDALASGDLKAGQIVDLIYDGTNFQMVSPIAADSAWVDLGTQPLTALYSFLTFPHALGVFPSSVSVMLKCRVADVPLGYLVNDELPIHCLLMQTPSDGNIQPSVTSDSTDVYVNLTTNNISAYNLAAKKTDINLPIVRANWDVRVRVMP